MSDEIVPQPRQSGDGKPRLCIGYGDREGDCSNIAGTPWTPLWCAECDEERRDTITRQMAEIRRAFDA